MAFLLRQPRFRNAFLLRGMAAWVLVRMALALASAGHPALRSDLPLPAEIMVLLLAGWLVILDARRRNEDLFLANLGIPLWPIGLLGALGALPPELLVP